MIMEEQSKDNKPSNIMICIGLLLLIWDSFMLLSLAMVAREPFGAYGGFGALIVGSIIITLIYLSKLGKDIGENFNNKDDK